MNRTDEKQGIRLISIYFPFLVVALTLILMEWISLENRIDRGVENSLQADREDIRQFSANPLFGLYLDNLYYRLEPEIALNEERINRLIKQKQDVAEQYGRPDYFITILSSDGDTLISSDIPEGMIPDMEPSELPKETGIVDSRISGDFHITVAPVTAEDGIGGYVAIWNHIPDKEIARNELGLMVRNLAIILLSLVILQTVFQLFIWREKRRTGSIIREQQQYYKAVVEGHRGYIYIIDSDCNIEFMNDQLTRFVGEGKLGEKCYDVLFGQKAPCPWCNQAEEEKSGVRSFEFQNPADSVWYSVVKSPVVHEGGSESTLIIMQDISSQKEAEEEVSRTNSYIKSILASMPSVLIGVDKEERITQWNVEAEKLTGAGAGEAVGRPLGDVFPRLEGDLPVIRDAIENKEKREILNRPFLEGESPRFEDVTIFPIISEDQEGVVIRLDDVTERRQVEELMIQSEKMLSVGGLAAGMAHEINNPLMGIMLSAEMVAKRLGLDEGMGESEIAAEKAGITLGALRAYMNDRCIYEMLENIGESGKRIATIISNMLDFSRKSEHIKSSYQLTELLDKALKLLCTDLDLKKQYNFRYIDIVREYGKDLPPVACEGPEIQQVIMNILRNGAQAMQEAKTPDPCFILRAVLDDTGNSVVLEIEDNGPGIDRDTQKRIFEPFFTTKPVGVGTGLGLSVSYFIITEKHKGHLSVRSEEGAGTTFIISLPLTV